MHSTTLPKQTTLVQSRPPFSLLVTLGNAILIIFLIGRTINDRHPALSDINRVEGIVLLLLYVACHFVHRLKVPPEVLLFGAFVIWTIASGLTVATDYAIAMSYLRVLVQLWGMVLIVAGFAVAQKSAKMTFFAIVACALFLVAYSRATGDYALGTRSRGLSRAMGVLANPNTFAFLMLYGVMGLAYFWGTANRWFVRLAMPVLFVPFTLSIFASGSRKTFAALVIFVIAWLLYCYGRLIFRKAYAIPLIVVVIVGMAGLTNYMYHETNMGKRFAQSIEAGGVGETRANMYVRGWELFADNPIAGVGVGNFITVAGFGIYSHSDYIEVLSTTGFIGFVLYFSVYVLLWRRLNRIKKATDNPKTKYCMGLFKAITLALLCLGFGTPNFLSVYHWFPLAAMIGASYAVDRDLRFRRVPIQRRPAS